MEEQGNSGKTRILIQCNSLIVSIINLHANPIKASSIYWTPLGNRGDCYATQAYKLPGSPSEYRLYVPVFRWDRGKCNRSCSLSVFLE